MVYWMREFPTNPYEGHFLHKYKHKGYERSIIIKFDVKLYSTYSLIKKL